MHRSLTTRTLIVLVLSALATAACGDDSPENDSGGGSGGSTRAGTGGGTAKFEPCGSAMCKPPADGMGTACCRDPFTSTCGFKTTSGGTCVPAVEGDPRCPSVNIMGGGIILPSCCTDDDQCGINPASFGMPGCVDLKTAAMNAMSMAGGVVMFPEPRACGDAMK